MNIPKPMTPFRKGVLDFIIAYHNEHKFSPTIREICEGLKHSSTSAVKYCMDQLIEDGYLTPGIPNSGRTNLPTGKELK